MLVCCLHVFGFGIRDHEDQIGGRGDDGRNPVWLLRRGEMMQAKLHFVFPNFRENFSLFVILTILSISLIRDYAIYYPSFIV